VVERVVESARQIDVTARTVPNQILTEQFDTVMPLLMHKRLRPHVDWTEIESDFGGKVRGSLNFTVGDGYNPQFLILAQLKESLLSDKGPRGRNQSAPGTPTGTAACLGA